MPSCSHRPPPTRRPTWLLRSAAVAAVIVVSGCGGDPKATSSTATAVPPGTLTVTPGQARTFNFDDTTPGQAPTDTATFAGRWLVEDATDAPSPGLVLCQRETATFPAIRLGADTYADVSVTTKFKAIAGSEDQAAGVMGRVVNDRNYYVARANVLEGSVNIYLYVNGSRSLLAEGKADVRQGTWQVLTLDIR